jgi:hypothetical protein
MRSGPVETRLNKLQCHLRCKLACGSSNFRWIVCSEGVELEERGAKDEFAGALNG